MFRKMLSIALVLQGFSASPKPARAYDMDCAIMLCMAGGFPPSTVCAAAYAEMIRRITPWPSQPPFGVCTYGAPGAETVLATHSSDLTWLNRTRVIWWSGSSRINSDDGRSWSWSIRSCAQGNQECQVIDQGAYEDHPWPTEFLSENGQVVVVPGSNGHISGRSLMVETTDIDGRVKHSPWINY